MNNETTVSERLEKKNSYSLFISGWQRSLSGNVLVASVLVTFLFVVYQVFQWGDEKQISFFSDLMQAIVSIAAVILAWQITRNDAIDDKSKFAWRLLTGSFAAYSFGHVVWFYYSSILKIEPFPSIADVGFWVFYPLMLWALLKFPTAETAKSDRVKFLMDVGIVTLGGATAVWNFIIRPTLQNAAESDLTSTLLNLSYVVGDLVLFLGIATILLRRPAEINRIALWAIVAGLINTAIADIGFAYFTLQGTYASGHWVDNFFIIGLLCFIAAPHFQFQKFNAVDEYDAEELDEVKPQGFSWLPYLAILVVFGILLYETQQFWGDWLGVIIFSTLGMTGLVVLRQLVAVKENIRLHSEHSARQSEMKFKALVEHSSDLITFRDISGKARFRSPSFKTVLGYEPEELDNFASMELIHPDDVEDLRNSFEKLERGDVEVFEHEYRFKHKAGDWRVLEGIAKRVTDETSGLQGIIVNSRDVTARKSTEERLRIYTEVLEKSNREIEELSNSYKQIADDLKVSEADLITANNFTNNIMDSMVDFVVVLDMDLKIQRVNPAMLKLNGYTEDELIGKSVNMLVADRPFTQNGVKVLRKAGFVTNLDKINRRKDGSTVSISLSMSILKDNNGNETGIVCVGKDVTEIVKARKNIEAANERLRRSNRELQDFAYVASHDLQEPLRKVQAFGDRLNRKFAEVLPEEGQDYIRRMRDAAGRMQNLINDLLTFSRVTTKAQPFQSVDLKRIAGEVVSDLEVRIEQTKGTVEIGDLPCIDADPVQMRQLLQNLIGNALKFHRTDCPPVIRVFTESGSSNGASFEISGEEVQTRGNEDEICRIVIQDNGIGFDEKYVEKIFTVFQRLHGRSEYEGSGIGLAVCRKIVERHRGLINANSTIGEGSTFSITLPLKQTNGDENTNETN